MQNYYQRPPFRQPYQNSMPARRSTCDTNNQAKKELSLAMAYVPWQHFEEPYPICKGFVRGTIFEELDKPFLGKGGCCS